MTSVAARSPRVLLAGVSTRAIAESAARAGYAVTAIDAFADLDQHPDVRAVGLAGRFTPYAAVQAGRAVDCDAVAYLSNFENHPGAVRELAAGRTLWGNPPDVLRAVRNPRLVVEALARRSLPAPALGGDGLGPWLLKPLASGGGASIRPFKQGTPVPAGHYVQQYIEGEPGSVAFVASREGMRVLGVFHQLIGRPSFGASGFRYCGSILDGSTAAASWMANAGADIAGAVTAEFGLRGVNGVDFVARGGVLYPVEINPRWTASVELIERAYGMSAFDAHVRACTNGSLPCLDGITAAPLGRSIGKAVIYARETVTVGDAQSWGSGGFVRDVPRPHVRIRPGEPVCTIFGDGPSPADCLAQLEERAAWVYDEVRAWTPTT